MYEIFVEKVSQRGGIRGVIRSVIHHVLHLIYTDTYREIIDKRIELYLLKLSYNSKYIGIPAWDDAKKVKFDKNIFETLTLHKFEDGVFPIPEKYDEVLKLCYGEYMKLPPEHARCPYHAYKLYRKDICSAVSEK